MDAPPIVGRTPDKMPLDIPGSAGPVWANRLRSSRATVLVGGQVAKRMASGGFVIPMLDGSTETLAIRSLVAGYPTITWRGATLFRSERPGVPMVLLAVLAAAAGAFAGFFLFPAVAAPVLGAGAAVGSLVWMTTRRSSGWLRYGPVVAAIAVLVAAGFSFRSLLA